MTTIWGHIPVYDITAGGESIRFVGVSSAVMERAVRLIIFTYEYKEENLLWIRLHLWKEIHA